MGMNTIHTGSLILLGCVALTALLTFLIASYLRVWRKPLIRCTATVMEKRTASMYHGVGCFVTFAFEGGLQEELAVDTEIYSALQVGQVGPLTRRGTRVLSFEPQAQAQRNTNAQR